MSLNQTVDQNGEQANDVNDKKNVPENHPLKGI